MRASKSPKKIVFIQGNISSGKSTLTRNLKEKGYVVYEEPVDLWTNDYKDDQGTNSLQLFYQKMKETAFLFEMLVARTRWKIITKALQSDDEIIFIERNLDTDLNVFALNLFESGLMNELEWRLFKEYHQDKIEDISHLFKDVEIFQLYLRANPEVCFERKHGRNRQEEKGIPLDYFKVIHQRHDNWLGTTTVPKNKIHIINGNASIEKVLDDSTVFINDHLL